MLAKLPATLALLLLQVYEEVPVEEVEYEARWDWAWVWIVVAAAILLFFALRATAGRRGEGGPTGRGMPP